MNSDLITGIVGTLTVLCIVILICTIFSNRNRIESIEDKLKETKDE